MIIFSDSEFIQHFLPASGVHWPDFASGSATVDDPADDRAGIYVFTNYAGPLRPNAVTWRNDDTMPGAERGDLGTAAVEAVVHEKSIAAARPIPTVLYAGRSTSRSLADRLADYTRQRESRIKPALLHLIRNHPDRLYIRWCNAFHWETSLINRYAPEYNSRQTGAAIEVGSAAFNWSGRITWQRCQREIGNVTSGPGLYAFTTPLGNDRIRRGQVHYIGEAGNVRARLRLYADGGAPSAQAERFVEEVLRQLPPTGVYVRWVQNLIFENEIIRILKPVLNVSSTSFEWDED